MCFVHTKCDLMNDDDTSLYIAHCHTYGDDDTMVSLSLNKSTITWSGISNKTRPLIESGKRYPSQVPLAPNRKITCFRIQTKVEQAIWNSMCRTVSLMLFLGNPLPESPGYKIACGEVYCVCVCLKCDNSINGTSVAFPRLG